MLDLAPHPRVLVVVPTLNECRHIETVLRTLVAEAPQFPAGFRIVVADGGSTDGTRERVERFMERHPEVRLLHNPARIQSAAINAAVRAFGRVSDVLIRVDAHAGYPDGYCRRLVETLGRTGADAVVVPLDSQGERCFQRAVAWVSNSPIGTGGAAHRGGRRGGFVDHGHHAAFRVDSFRRVGGYDETFTHNEDAELDCRQRAVGARLYLDAEVRVLYHPRDTPRALWRQYFHYGTGRSRTARRHPASLRLRQLAVPVHLAATFVCVGLAPAAPPLLAWPALYLMVLSITSVAFAVRHRTPCGLLTGPAAGIMHTAWGAGFLLGLLRRRERAWTPRAVVPLELAPEEEGGLS